jgi:superoxide dismutase, Fe-Mn family
MAFELSPLPYEYNALEPYIDTLTMQIHHDKHHAAYVTNLNKALESAPELQDKSLEWLFMNLESVPESIRTAVRNNGGGHFNHTMYWEIMGPSHMAEGEDTLAKVSNFAESAFQKVAGWMAVTSAFGSVKDMIAQVNAAGMGRFGSGWAWVVMNSEGKLSVTSTPNQDNPMSTGLAPILGIDVWEHAYYLHYQNRRADYLNAWWNVVNWDEVAARYSKALKYFKG